MTDARRARWPRRLRVVRHGESAGNVARDAADAAGLARIDIAVRDLDVPLSERGSRRARDRRAGRQRRREMSALAVPLHPGRRYGSCPRTSPPGKFPGPLFAGRAGSMECTFT